MTPGARNRQFLPHLIFACLHLHQHHVKEVGHPFNLQLLNPRLPIGPLPRHPPIGQVLVVKRLPRQRRPFNLLNRNYSRSHNHSRLLVCQRKRLLPDRNPHVQGGSNSEGDVAKLNTNSVFFLHTAYACCILPTPIKYGKNVDHCL